MLHCIFVYKKPNPTTNPTRTQCKKLEVFNVLVCLVFWGLNRGNLLFKQYLKTV